MNVPSQKQLSDEFGLYPSSITSMKNRGDKGIERLGIYKRAWLYRVIISFMPQILQKKVERIIPTDMQLVEEFGTTKQNFNEMKKSRNSRMYDAYVDCWNLEYIIFKKIVS